LICIVHNNNTRNGWLALILLYIFKPVRRRREHSIGLFWVQLAVIFNFDISFLVAVRKFVWKKICITRISWLWLVYVWTDALPMTFGGSNSTWGWLMMRMVPPTTSRFICLARLFGCLNDFNMNLITGIEQSVSVSERPPRSSSTGRR
jgi:hypothetical protein